MKFKVGDFVVVNDPTPYLDDDDFTNGLYFNDRMRVFIGRMFRVTKEDADGTYRLAYIDKSDSLEDTYDDVVTRWSWNKKWLMQADEFTSDEIDCCDLPDIMSMLRG